MIKVCGWTKAEGYKSIEVAVENIMFIDSILEKYPSFCAFEYNAEGIPISRKLLGEPWQDYKVPWEVGNNNSNHDVCRKLKEKLRT